MTVPPVVERVLGARNFTVEKFVENFGVLVEAAGGVPRLRLLLLGTACLGRILGDRPNTQRSSESGGPWPLPESWDWKNLGHVVSKIANGLSTKQTTDPTPYRVTRIETIATGFIDMSRTGFVPECSAEDIAKYHMLAGDILFSHINSVPHLGKTALVQPEHQAERLLHGTNLILLRPNRMVIEPDYLNLVLRFHRGTGRTARDAQHAIQQASINQGMIRQLEVPLPPLAEQKRIVARVDQLMALIDQLEAKQTRKRELGARFTKASLEALTTAESPQDFQSAWTRIQENWDTLLDSVEKVGEVRKTIVALALRGKLLAQVFPEGKVDTLLQVLARHGIEVRKAEIEGLPSLPKTWAWVHLGSLITFGPKNGYSPKAVERPTKVKSLTLSATTSGAFDGRFFKYIDEDLPDDSNLWLSDGDILVQRGNTIEYVGVAAIFRGPSRTFIYPDLMMKFRVAPELDLDFIHLALNGPWAREFITSHASGTSGTMPKINQGTLLDIPIPLPPAKEQHRIAERVQGLMKLCDALESALRRSEDCAAKVAEATVKEMVA